MNNIIDIDNNVRILRESITGGKWRKMKESALSQKYCQTIPMRFSAIIILLIYWQREKSSVCEDVAIVKNAIETDRYRLCGNLFRGIWRGGLSSPGHQRRRIKYPQRNCRSAQVPGPKNSGGFVYYSDILSQIPGILKISVRLLPQNMVKWGLSMSLPPKPREFRPPWKQPTI